MPVAEDLPVTEEQAKAGVESREVVSSRAGSTGAQSRIDDEEREEQERAREPEAREAPQERDDEPDVAPPPVSQQPTVKARGLKAKAAQIAKTEEAKTGTPAKITEDRLLNKPGWREREIAFLAKQTKTPKAKVKQVQDRGADEAQGLQLARSFLVTKQKRQQKAGVLEKEHKAEERLAIARERIKKAKATGVSTREIQKGEKTLTVGKNTSKPQKILDTLEMRQLKKDNPRLFGILDRQGIDAFNKAISEQKFTGQQERKRFNKLNQELPDGQFISKKDLAKIKKEAPEVHTALVSKGFNAARKVNIRQVGTGTVKKKDVFRFPVLMSRPETIASDIATSIAPLPKGDSKKNPGKFFVDFLVKKFERQTKPEEQSILKAAFEAQEAQPLWLKMLGGGGSLILKNRDGKFTRVLAMDFPVAPGGRPGRFAIPKILRIGKSVRTVTPKDVGMDEAQFARFIKARMLNPKLDTADFKAKEVKEVESLMSQINNARKKIGGSVPKKSNQ